MINYSDPSPLREQLASLLRKEFLGMDAPSEGRLPSVREIGKKYGVSRNTVAWAIADLRKQGLLSTRNKTGIFLGNNNKKVSRDGDVGVICSGGDLFTLGGLCISMFAGVRVVTGEAGRNVVLPGLRPDLGEDDEWVALSRTGRIAGVICFAAKPPPRKAIARLIRSGVSVVVVDHFDSALNVDCVMFDNLAASTEVMQRLLKLGHRRIAFINGTEGVSAAERHEAYKSALGQAGIRYDARLVRSTYPLTACGRNAMREMLPLNPTAVFTFNDFQGIGAMQAAVAAGLRVPEDFSVATFGDEAREQDLEKRLTTVRADTHAMGRAAAERLLLRMNGHNSPPEKIYVACPLVEGDTTGPCQHERRP